VRRRLFLLLPFLALSAACGGGGGGGGSPTEPTPPPPPPPGITFTADSGSGQTGIILGSGSGTTVDTLVLEVRANNVQDLYGVGFDLTYPNTLLRFEGATPGFLNDGQQVSFNLVETSPGTLVVGYARLGAVSGASGSGVILTLRFTATAAGTGRIAFAQNTAFNSRGDMLGLTWTGGSVTIVR
jgi:hypothetical protein